MRDVQQSTPLELGPYYTKGIRFRETVRVIEREHPKTLLNVGCQYGYIESVLPDELQVLSIDIDPAVLEMAKAVNAGKPNREFLLLDLFDLPTVFPSRSFDAIIMSEVIEHIEDDVGALRVAGSHLLPGGTLLVTVPSLTRFPNRLRVLIGKKPQYMTPNHLHEYTLESGRAAVEQAGLACVEMAGLDFRFPQDLLAQRVVPLDFAGRRWLGSRFPRIASYLMYVCRKPAVA